MTQPDATRPTDERGDERVRDQVGPRVHEDAALVELVRKAGPDSIEAHELQNILLHGGTGTLLSLYARGQLLESVRSLKIPVPEPPPNWAADAPDLIREAVATSVEPFMDEAIFDHGWSATGGASVTNYFKGACLIRFAGIYRDHWGRVSTEILTAAVHGDEPGDPDDDPSRLDRLRLNRRFTDGPESLAVNGDTVRRLSKKMSPHQRQIIFWTALKETQREIGDRLGISASSVSSDLGRIRKKIRRQWGMLEE